MAESMQTKLRRAALKTRQREVEQCLAEHGLSRGPRRLLRDASRFDERTHCRRLREALVRLGPVFSSFGIYLSSRVDLLPVSYCLELSAVPDRTEPDPLVSIREMFRRSVGCRPEEAFVEFDAEPFESRLLFQSHHAWLEADGPVTVKLMRCEIEEQIETDSRLLPLLKDALATLDLAQLQIDLAIADFHRALRRQMDLNQELGSLEAFAHDSKEFTMLAAPRVHEKLCSSEVLTIERLSGTGLGDIVSSLDRNGGAAGIDPGNLASTLCLVWLRQTLLGSLLPVEPLGTNVVVLPNQQIAFRGGSFAKLSTKVKANLWNYVTSASAEDFDKACSCLLTEMELGKRSEPEKDLVNGFRQVVPFRDGGWSDSCNGTSLAEHLFVQWRLASRKGLRPQSHLIDFYRGLFQVCAVARRLDTGRDSLREGLDNLRLMAALAQFREMVGAQQLGESMDKYAAMMTELPKKLDEVLTLAAEGSALVKLQVSQTSQRRKQKNSAAAAIALSTILVSCALLSQELAGSAMGGVWIDRIGAVALVFIGGMLLRVVIRR